MFRGLQYLTIVTGCSTLWINLKTFILDQDSSYPISTIPEVDPDKGLILEVLINILKSFIHNSMREHEVSLDVPVIWIHWV